MTKPKKLISLLMAIIMVLPMIVVSANAAMSRGFEYTVTVDNNGAAVAEIIEYKGSSAHVSIPSTLGGYPVNAIRRNAFRGNKVIQAVKMGAYVDEIDADAFKNCINLRSISLGSVEFISQGAFENCKNLTEVNIPATLIGVTGDVFSGCKKLKRFSVSSDNYYYQSINGVLVKKGNPYIVAYPQGKGRKYVVPAGITAIGEGAFRRNTSIKRVVLGKDVQEISENAFQGCSNLRFVRMGDNVTEVGVQAFKNCGKLKKVIFPKGMIAIEDEAFLSCKKLKKVSLHSNIRSIGYRAFGYIRKGGKYQKLSGFTIVAPEYSQAYNYAKGNGFNFISK